jgi:hypothetical protein
MSTGFSRPRIRKMFNGVSPAEIAFIDGVTAGTATASKALVLDSSKGIGTITSATITTLTGTTANVPTVNATNVDAGASGTAGSVDVFPTTASKGKLAITCTDQTGNTTVGLVAGAMGQATVLTIQDPGGSTANIVTSTGIGATLGARCTTQFDAVTGTTGTTLTNIVGLTVNVLAAGVYSFDVYLAGTATANSGVKFAIAGTATVTSISYTGANWNGTTQNARSTTTTGGNAVGAATAVYTDGRITGTVVVNAAGTLTVQAAQNAAHADTTSVYVNSHMVLRRIA